MINRGYRTANNLGDFNLTSPFTTEEDVLKSDFYSLVSRCADLHRNNSTASAVSSIMVSYAGQTGNKLNLADQELQRKTEGWMKNCTVRGDNFTTLRNMRITDTVESGGPLVLFTQNPDRKKGELGLKLDVIQGGRVATPSKFGNVTPTNGTKVINGVAYNSFGTEIGFYYKNDSDFKYVPKYNSKGWLNAYLERSPESQKPTSGRTLPLITSVIQDIEDRDTIKRYMKGYARNASSIGVVIETPDPQSLMSGMGVTNDDGTFKTEEFIDENTIIRGEVSPNMVMAVPPQTKGHFFTPEGSTNFDPIFKVLDRSISAGTGIPEEILAEATDGKNFAVSKFKSQGFSKKIKVWGAHFNVLDSIIVRQMWREAVLRGFIDEPETFVKWGGASDFDDVDILKSANASKVRIQSGISTQSEEVARRGGDFEENVSVTFGEIALIKKTAEEHKSSMGEYLAYQQGEIGLSKQVIEVEDGETKEIEEAENGN